VEHKFKDKRKKTVHTPERYLNAHWGEGRGGAGTRSFTELVVNPSGDCVLKKRVRLIEAVVKKTKKRKKQRSTRPGPTEV